MGRRKAKQQGPWMSAEEVVRPAATRPCTDSSPGAVWTDYVYDAMGKLAAEYPSSGSADGSSGCGTATCYLLADHLGSTRLMTDASGNVKQRYDYLPFGEGIPASIGGRTTEMGYLTSPDAVAYVRQLFTGQYRDRESALDYFNARYYSPQQGRFVSPDPQNAGAYPSNPQTWNGYAYVGNNPLNITDLNGESWWHWVIGGAAAALGFPQFFAGAMAAAGGAAIPAVAAAQAAAASAGFGFMVSSSVDAVVNRRPPVIGLFQGGNPSGLFNCGGPFGNCGPSDYAWNEDHSALQRTQVDPLMIFTFQQWDRNGREILANGDVAIYGWLGNRGRVLKAAGERATHDMACAGLGFAVGDLGAGMFVAGRPMIDKPFSQGGMQQTSAASEAFRDITKGARGGVRLPTLIGGSGTGMPLKLRMTNSVGAVWGRWLPYAGAGFTALGAYEMYGCLSQ